MIRSNIRDESSNKIEHSFDPRIRRYLDEVDEMKAEQYLRFQLLQKHKLELN
ncbi:MAG: hypothetical protein PVF96_06160 [Candidatus Bathyarchaeota archaeon]